jgi:hypothetical protein
MTTAPNTEPPNRVAIYARYSTDLQNGRSIEDQLKTTIRMNSNPASSCKPFGHDHVLTNSHSSWMTINRPLAGKSSAIWCAAAAQFRYSQLYRLKCPSSSGRQCRPYSSPW